MHSNVDHTTKQWHGAGNIAYRSSRFQGWPLGWVLPAAVALLILYGSLYPFEFSEPAAGAVLRVFTEWHLLGFRGDMLGNFALFVPWGLAGMVILAPRAGAWRAAGITALTGFVLALGCQIAQVWIPARDASLADVFWNMAGLVAGLLLGPPALKHWRGSARRPATSFGAAWLLCAWLLAYWLPLVPSIDLQLLKDNLKLALNARAFEFMDVLSGMSMALMSGYLLSRLVSVRKSAIYLPALLALAAVGKLFIQGTHIEIGVALGFVVGAVLWGFSPWVSGPRRTLIVALALIGVYTVQALSPLEFRSAPAAFGWSPLAALLQGSMLANAQALADELLVFASFLFLVQISGGKPVSASFGLAVWVLALEYAQTFIETRTGEITAPLLVLLVGQAFRFADRQLPPTLPRVDDRAAPRETERPVRLMLPLSVGALAVLIAVATRLPGVPYNLRALLNPYHPLMAPVALAVYVFWVAGVPALAARWLETGRRASLLLPIAVALHATLAWALVREAVLPAMIHKVAGSPILGWPWEWETLLRFGALQAALFVLLTGGCVAVRFALRQSGIRALLTWMCWAALLLPALHYVIVDLAATDNLTELMAGGGGPLASVMLALWCLLVGTAGSLLAVRQDGRGARIGMRLLAAGLSIPLGYVLLWAGLEPHVQKYGASFSALQFLLSADRQHYAGAWELGIRYIVFHVGVVGLIALAQLPLRGYLGGEGWGEGRPARDPHPPPSPASGRGG